MRVVPALVAIVVAIAPAYRASGQNSRPGAVRQPPSLSRGRLPVAGCAGQTISDIVILTQPPYTDRVPARFEFLRRGARTLHETTRDNVVRRYLLLHRGEPCNQIRRAESERILRAQPFLQDARIRVYDDEAGGVRLEVETRDEFSLLVEPAVSAASPMFRGLRVGESNLAGSARLAALEWRDGLSYHDVLGAQLTDYQFLGGRQELRLLGKRFERGQELHAQVIRPYYTDLQRFAFIGSLDGTRDYITLLRPAAPAFSLNARQQSGVFGGIARVGATSRLKLLGLTLSRTRLRVDSNAVRITRDGFVPDSGARLDQPFRQQNVTRANALLGLRLLRFVPVQGFDALTGTQDVRVGMQLGMTYGRSIGFGGATDRDDFVAGGLYAGVGGPKSFVGMQLNSEARRERGYARWEDHIASGRMGWYFRPAVHQLTLVSAEWSAGRDMRRPFQLSFADLDGGLHGYRRTETPGAERLVMRAEQRLVIPSRQNVADVGIAGFVEAGKLWGQRSVPFSVTTPVQGAVGVSVLAAVPPRSRRLWRVDFAMPVGNDPKRRFEIRFSNEDHTRSFWNDPRDVMGARERTTPTSLFTWP